MFRKPILITAILSSVLALTSCIVAQQPPQGAPWNGHATSNAVTPGDQRNDDPNFPRSGPGNIPGLKMSWRYLGDQLLVIILDPQLRTGPSQPELLGYDDRGSLLTNGAGQVLRWNLQQNSLTVAYKNRGEIPLDVLTSLHHTPGADIDYLIVAKGGKPRNQQPAQTREPTQAELAQKQREQDAPNHQGGGVVHQQDLAEAIANLGNGKPAPSGTITGTGAALLPGDFLTFRANDGRQLKYKVERQAPPSMTVSTPGTSGDVAGTWLAFNINGNANDNKIISVDGGGGVTVRDMDARLKATFERVRKMTGVQ